MKIVVVFDFPEISDLDSDEATFEIDSLSADINSLHYSWYIDDVVDSDATILYSDLS